MKFESALKWFVRLKSPMACKVDKLVMMEAINDSFGCRVFGDETCDLGIESLDDLDLVSHSWKERVSLSHEKYRRATRGSEAGIMNTGLDEGGQRWGIGTDVEIHAVTPLTVV